MSSTSGIDVIEHRKLIAKTVKGVSQLPRGDHRIQDLIQGATLDLLENGHRYDPTRWQPSTFIVTCVKNWTINELTSDRSRQKREREYAEDTDMRRRGSSPAVDVSDADAVDAIMRGASDSERLMLRRKFWDEWNLESIGDEAGISKQGASMRMTTFIAKCRRRFGVDSV